MLKTVTLLKRREDLTPAEFQAHWREVHAPLVLSIPGVRGYVQGRPIPGDGDDPPCDGVAEVWYDDLQARDRAFRTSEYEAVLDDERNFLGATTAESAFVTVVEERLL
jgi:uncharacterized protein (TIGR02118 family)